jgi:tetrapyrrole methylase family protein/MazG family protein
VAAGVPDPIPGDDLRGGPAGTSPQGGAAAAFDRLFAIIRRLRAPDGCPWDREQSPETLRPSLIEEAWEAVSAIDSRDDANLREELGDLFLVISMMAWMREESGAFSLEEVLQEICEKLIRRHPHVFGGPAVETSREVLRQWDHIKATEHEGGPASSALDRVPRSLPPLERSFRVQKKAAKAGFDWPSAEPVWDKIQEELRELQAEIARGARDRVEDEAGDVLFSIVNLLRMLHVDPGVALHTATTKFERRFRSMERTLAAQGVNPAHAGLERLDQAWNEVKACERAGQEKAQDNGGVEGRSSASK